MKRTILINILIFLFAYNSNSYGYGQLPPPNLPPTPSIEVEGNEFAISEDIYMMDAVGDPDGDIVKYEWDFDNNGTFDLTTTYSGIMHSYSDAGTYTIKLQTTDDDGATGIDTCTVYVEAPPTPSTMTWAVQPYQSGAGAITMVACEALDSTTPVMYYFHCASGGGHDSGWQISRIYTDMNLSSGIYSYEVKARDRRNPPNANNYGGGTFSVTISTNSSTPVGDSESVSGELENDLANFSVDPYTGSANYSIPIIVPPARGGTAPEITLAYSGGGNGWCGVGWSLGMGTIQRNTKKGVPIKMNSSGFITPYLYDIDKGFVVSFQGTNCDLIKTGSNGSIYYYRAEVDKEFLKFELDTTNNNWTVTDKSGNKYYFGSISGANSKMINPDSGWSSESPLDKTFLWALDKIEDINGNLTWINYTIDSYQVYLSDIYYNGNSYDTTLDEQSDAPYRVQFTLETAYRTDKSISYNSGYRVETRKRLNYITVSRRTGAGSYERIRKYDLYYGDSNHNYSDSTKRTLLRSVTLLGIDDTAEATMPAIEFTYSQKPFEFDQSINWPNVNLEDCWHPYRDYEVGTLTTMLDINGDGLPDRISQWSSNDPNFKVELNNGTGFENRIDWGSLYEPPGDYDWTRISVNVQDDFWHYSVQKVDLSDINGDGFPDRILYDETGSKDRYKIQLNNKLDGFEEVSNWLGLQNEGSFSEHYRAICYNSTPIPNCYLTLLDINGDGLSDRVMKKRTSPIDSFMVQLNNGSAFDSIISWKGVTGQYDYQLYPISTGTGGTTYVTMLDINGDGLIDRVRYNESDHTIFKVQLNRSYCFAPEEDWGPLINPPYTNWAFPQHGGRNTDADLFDINGDGLPDRVMNGGWLGSIDRNMFKVQLNTGSGFEKDNYNIGVVHDWIINWSPSDVNKTFPSYNMISSYDSGTNTSIMLDIDADGLPDRVFKTPSWTNSNFKVQKNSGEIPDVLKKITGTLGGSIDITYKSSTPKSSNELDKHKDSSTNGINRLSFPINTVDSVTVKDGFGGTGATSHYVYSRGMYDHETHEFRGFGKVEVTDPCSTKTIHYYHQGGGWDDTSKGEFQDDGSIAKKGMAYRTEIWGSDGKLYKVTTNKIVEDAISSGVTPDSGRTQNFAYIAKTVNFDYEGTNNDAGAYRAKAKEFQYDPTNENFIKEIDWGEISGVSFDSSDYHWTDVNSIDNLYAHTVYATFASNADILNKINWTKETSDINPVEAPDASQDFKKTVYTYDESIKCGYSNARGNVTTEKDWLNIKNGGPIANYYVTKSYYYDELGNPRVTTDETGISTTTEFDNTYKTFPIRNVKGTGTINVPGSEFEPYKFYDETNKFITTATSDLKSGKILTSTDVMGIETDYTYDKLLRLTDIHKATEPGGAATLYVTHIDYNLASFTGTYPNKITNNYIHQQFAGYEAYVYNDGLGRVVQTRTKAETGAAGEYRVENTAYDKRSNERFKTLPFFSNGSGFTTGSQPGIKTEYDVIGRISKVTPPAGDTGSPTGPVETKYKDVDRTGTESLWINVTTDAKGKKKKQHFDASGNVIILEELMTNPTAVVETHFTYDKLNRLTEIEDDSDVTTPGTSDTIYFTYDSHGRKISMDDPDMGYWTYEYDDSGKILKQTDGKGQVIRFIYNDEIGRLKQKKTYSSETDLQNNNPASVTTYIYDISTEPDYPVYKGLLYKIIDSEGYVKNGYDSRGRNVKTTRHLDRLSDYTTIKVYDDADRIKEVSYPGGYALVKYNYDSAGHLSAISSPFFRLQQANHLQTDNAETFYQASSFNALEQLEGVDYGNGVQSRYEFYSSSKRRKRIHSYKSSTQLQDLNYTFDENANITLIRDDVTEHTNPEHTNEASSTFSNIQYDDLNRLTQLTYTVQGVTSFSYNKLGNLLSSSEGVGSSYTYGAYNVPGSKPHAVLSAYGTAYGYDDCGNMTTRGNQTLTYDEENRLIGVSGAGVSVQFKYDGTGRRLYKEKAGDVVNLWIDEIYEEKDHMVFCHILAGDGMVATFLASNLSNPQPPVNSLFYYYHNDHLGSSSIMTDRSGNQVKYYGYRAYGNERYNNPTVAYNVSKRFTSKILDEDVDLYYYGARYYDAKIGRFVQADPVIPGDVTQNSQSLNRYSYCFNNPLKFTDPTGNEPEDTEREKEAAKQKAQSDAKRNAGSSNSNGGGNGLNDSSGIKGSGTPDGRSNGSGGYSRSGWIDAVEKIGDAAGQGAQLIANSVQGVQDNIIGTANLLTGWGILGELAGMERLAPAISSPQWAQGMYVEQSKLVYTAEKIGGSLALGYGISKAASFISSKGGPYSNLADPPSVGSGKPFTKSQKDMIKAQNQTRNCGILRSDGNGTKLVSAQRHTKGVTPPSNEAHVDHIIPRSQGGSNSYSNAQILSRKENLGKGRN